MKMRLCLVLLFLYVPMAFCGEAFAVDSDIADRYPSSVLWPEGSSVSEAEYLLEPKRDVDVRARVSVLQGYDNNVELNSKRLDDGFLQSAFALDLAYDLDGPVTLRGGGDIFSRVYYKHNSSSLLDIMPYVGADWQITPDVVSRTRVSMDYLLYPKDHDNTYIGLVLGEHLRHYITENFYHELGYEYVHRWYPTRRITLANLTEGSDKRKDSRHRVNHTFAWQTGNLLLMLDNRVSFNSSNVEYRNYYDWRSYRIEPTVMYFFTEDLYASGSFIYRYTYYRDRRVSNNANKKVRDNNYIVSGSLFYELTENATAGLTYSYVENSSNDSFQEYSGSMLTGGLYYDF